MFTEFFTHFSILILPLLLYQLWAFRRSFNQLPYAIPIIGLYGGISAIFSEVFPVHIFGMPYDLKVIPLTLSFLYGKPYAGFISFVLAASYRYHVGHSGALLAVLSMAVYSIPPCLLSKRFDSYLPFQRILISTGLSFLGTGIQLLFVYLYFASHFPGQGSHALLPYLHTLLPGAAMQAFLMFPSTMVIEHMVETGRVRSQLIKYQSSLKESEERYRSFVEHNPDGVAAVDKEGRLIFANQAFGQITGYAVEQLLGKDRFELWFETDRDIAEAIKQRAMNGEVLTNLDVDLRNQDGEEVPVRLNALPLIVSSKIVGYCAIVTDMRPVKKANDLIRRADKLATVGSLAAGIAHEIRNPLTSLKGFLKLLRSADPTIERYITVMESEMDRLYLVSNQLLALAKPQVENKKLCNLRVLLHETNDIMQPQALLAGVELAVTTETNNFDIVADYHQIKQVLINIIKNAIEATPSGGTVIVTLKGRDDHVMFEIRDTGTGIQQEILQRLGEPFYSTKTKGNGLGLMVSHRIVEDHGGNLKYETTIEQGTTVSVFLPRYEGFVQDTQRPSYETSIYEGTTNS